MVEVEFLPAGKQRFIQIDTSFIVCCMARHAQIPKITSWLFLSC